MKRSLLLTVLACLLSLADARRAQAQFIVGSSHSHAFGNQFALSRGMSFSYQQRGFRVAGFAGGFYSRSVFVAPLGPVWPVLPPVATLTPFGWTPGFLQPGWGVGPGWGWFVPPIIVVPPPIILAGNRVDAEGNNPALAFENLPRPIEPLPRGARPGDFLVISPKGGALAPGQIVSEVARVAAVARPPVPAFRFDPFAKRVTVEVEKPDPDPAREAARLVNVGRIAFAAGEYGKAAEQFDRAIAADPKAAVPHFLKAQSAFAAGRYTDAVAAIRAGLALDPDWPTGTFDPKEPYGANAAAFAAHLAELRKVVAAAPGEATLEFLLGYELWFVGEKVDARKWFDAAAKRLTVPGPIALFK